METVDPRLSFTDTLFWLSDSPCVTNILIFEEGEQPPTRRDVEDWLLERIDRSPLLTSTITPIRGHLAYPRWVETGVDVRDHVTVEHCTTSGWSEIGRRLVRLGMTPLAERMPPWRMSVFTGVTDVEGFPETATVVGFQMSHAAVDGLALAHLIRTLFGPERREQWRFEVERFAGLRSAMDTPVKLTRLLRAVGKSLTSFTRTAVASPHPLLPRTRLNGKLTGEAEHTFVTLGVQEMKRVGRTLGGCTVNDVALAVISGAMRSYLDMAGELPEHSLAVHVPISTRTAGPVLGNQVGSMSISLCTDIDDSEGRLRAIHEKASVEKRRFSETARNENWVENVPVPLLWAATKLPAPQQGNADQISFSNTIASNIPRGAANLSFLDMPVRSSLEMTGVVDGRGVSHMIASIGDVLTISVCFDSGILPDPEGYRGLLVSEFEALQVRADEVQAEAAAQNG
ncbi:wax ester/triacylglycerol synthase domain-containing protein [Prescottella sp. R16]|uniref:wax ester/triacylglycerol synthase domain-containing protein n=1 Tax=Prescottella sp. R16 TaxID=3064529 RepID=UPI00272E10D4|nr:wax ester/triacylglycerol synthase domain-containing protein [Prescottella sp. R16]